ncbi:MAG: hypothetical protein AAF986_04115 [Pseudomonadota bacterium]
MRSGFWMKVMGGLGALWLLYVLVSASQPYNSDAPTLSTKEAMAAIAGFDEAFPPRPLPPMTFDNVAGSSTLHDLATPILVTLFIPPRCNGCAMAIEKLTTTAALTHELLEKDKLHLTILYIRQATVPQPPTPAIFTLADPKGKFSRYINTKSLDPTLVVYYRDRGEVGRLTDGTSWDPVDLAALLQTLHTGT